MEDSKSSTVDRHLADSSSSASLSISPPSHESIDHHPHHHNNADDNQENIHSDSTSPDMAALVAPNNPTILPAVPTTAGINKRYRPAPAKTFQCRGYGECRMVFSRSEHLARHIRKHTGERPFTCHCSKQFSRLDNLRQHAQTVHADKHEQNERMMRELTSLHASMAAANKAGQSRGKRGHAAINAAAVIAASNLAQDAGMRSLDQVKEEDASSVIPPMHQRPGTSTGYEGGDNMMYGNGWMDVDRGDPRPPNNHSFRDSSRSFRVPPTSNASSFFGQQQSQSFLPFTTHTFNFGLSSRDGRPGSSSSRPPTAGGPDSHARTLPPLAAVVSATIPPPPSQPFPIPPQSTQHVLPLPGSAAFNRRPATASRPGTAPASYYPSKPAYAGGPGLVHQPELSVPAYGRSSELAAAAATAAAYHTTSFEAEPSSPTAYESPFSFHPPALAESTSAGSFASSPPANPRKRPFAGVDNSTDEGPRREPSNGLSGPGEYDYGSESRPQSRRLSVLELCNDPDADAGVRSFLSATPGSTSRPTTSSGLVSSASALALVDRPAVSGIPLFSGAQQAATSTVPSAAASPGAATTFGGGRVSPAFRRDTASPPASAAAGNLLSAHRGAFSASPLSDTSRSPRSSSAAFAAVARSVHVHSNPSSPSSHAATPPALSRRGEPQHEVRSPVTSAYSPAAVGMKV